MHTILTLIFWAAFIIPVSSFIIYPVFTILFARYTEKLRTPPPFIEYPDAALIISAFNEENIIRERIENALQLDYPDEKLKIIIHTDGSTDNTDAIISEFSDRRIIHLTAEENRGKTVCLSDAVNASGDAKILIFSDANSMFKPDALMKLVRWFKLKKVGSVCGRLEYIQTHKNKSEQGERAYWSFDTKLKILEGSNGYLLGGNGAIFAMRKSIFTDLPGEQSNDMILPIIARLRGYLNVYEPLAVAEETTASNVQKEYKRKVRIIARGLNGVVFSFKFASSDEEAKKISSSEKRFLLFQVIFKKFFRYLAFPSIITMMVAGFFTSGIAAIITILMWSSFFAALIATILNPFLKKHVGRFPDFSYSLAMALAACDGFYIWISGKKISQWKSQR